MFKSHFEIFTNYKNEVGIQVSKIGFTNSNFFYQKKGRLEIYAYPNDTVMWQKYLTSRIHTHQRSIDSLKTLYKKQILDSLFDVYAIWIDKKYIAFMRDVNQETGEEYTLPYIEDTTNVTYELYKLHKNKWQLIKTGKTIYDKLYSNFDFIK